MNLKDILALHDAGVDSDVLENFIRFSVAQNTSPTVPAQPVTTAPNVSRETLVPPPVFSGQQPIVPNATQVQPSGPDLNQKLDALTQLIQTSNILNAQQPEQKQLTLEDVMTDIISPRAVGVN